MNSIYDTEVNNIVELNLLNGIFKTDKRTKILYIHYSPILHGCMNTIKGKAKFKNFRILLDSGFSSTIFMLRLVENCILKNIL